MGYTFLSCEFIIAPSHKVCGRGKFSFDVNFETQLTIIFDRRGGTLRGHTVFKLCFVYKLILK